MSLKAKILNKLLKIIQAKDIAIWIAKNPPRNKKSFVPKNISENQNLKIHSQLINEKQIVTLNKINSDSKIHIVWFHGGAYILEALPQHWKVAKEIVNQNSCRLTLVDYPLAPENTYKETFKMVSKAYDKLVSDYPNDDFVFLGDSAGGGLAFAFNQKLIREKYNKLPFKTILLSPWLDITMSNPDIDRMEKQDNILTKKMLLSAGKQYSRGDNPKQYLLSPIYGDFNELPETLVIFSTHELFYPDCKKLQELTKESLKFNFIEYNNLPHDWVIMPIPEAQLVIENISQFIKS